MMMNSPTEQFGVHVMIDGYGADPQLLADQSYLLSLLHDLPRELGMHTICDPQVVEVGPMNPKDPGGISGFVMIAESHISFHTFPNRGFVTMDLYTCQVGMDADWAANRLKKAFGLTDADVFVQKRGLRYPSHDVFVPADRAA
jgi:S-adenosylmethionine decarboxylase